MKPGGSQIVHDQVGCARCHGEGHENLVFEELTYPVDLPSTGLLATHWSMCPTTIEPILMTFGPREEVKKLMETPQEDAAAKPEPAREHMEDARPQEPGTVGDQLEDLPTHPDQVGDAPDGE